MKIPARGGTGSSCGACCCPDATSRRCRKPSTLRSIGAIMGRAPYDGDQPRDALPVNDCRGVFSALERQAPVVPGGRRSDGAGLREREGDGDHPAADGFAGSCVAQSSTPASVVVVASFLLVRVTTHGSSLVLNAFGSGAGAGDAVTVGASLVAEKLPSTFSESSNALLTPVGASSAGTGNGKGRAVKGLRRRRSGSSRISPQTNHAYTARPRRLGLPPNVQSAERRFCPSPCPAL